MSDRHRPNYSTERRDEAFSRGMCRQCCCRPARPGRKTCSECPSRAVARRNVTAASGLCREQCGRQQKPGSRRCDVCLERRAEWARKARAAKAAAGVVMPRRNRVRVSQRQVVPDRVALIRAACIARSAAVGETLRAIG